MASELENTASLLARHRAGDGHARERLVERYLPIMMRWARGRLPQYARSNAETDDLLQVTFLRAINNLGSFEPRHEGAFLAYLRRIFLNTVRDEIRRYGRSPEQVEAENIDLVDEVPSAVEVVAGREKLARYEEALARLPERTRQAVMLRVEFQMTYDEIARSLDLASPDAARMAVTRSLAKLAESMKR